MDKNWKTTGELNRSGLILALCKDRTGIYHQLMVIEVNDNKKMFYVTGELGSSHRVNEYKIKAAVYIDDICSDKLVEKFCYSYSIVINSYGTSETYDGYSDIEEAKKDLKNIYNKKKKSYADSFKFYWNNDISFTVMMLDSYVYETVSIIKE